MPFPPHIEKIFETFGVPADTKAALYDLYVSLGDEALEVFGDVAESIDPSTLRPEHCAEIRTEVVERYLIRNHPAWLDGTPTPSLYRPRLLEGRASGVAIPLGAIPERATALLDGEPSPDGILVQGRNAHFGGRSETISFDVIARELGDAMALGRATGRQHTLPGSAGATSGTTDAANQIALLWEIQPNVYKPSADRNQDIRWIYRRHRNWHVITLSSAIEWLRAKSFRVFIVRGEALRATHEVRSGTLSTSIVAMHNRTVLRVAAAFGLELTPATAVRCHIGRAWSGLAGGRGVAESLQHLPHERALQHDAVFEHDRSVTDSAVSARFVQRPSTAHRGELQPSEPCRGGLLFGMPQDGAADATARELRSDKHRANTCRLGPRVEQLVVPIRCRAAAISFPPRTPAATPGELRFLDRNEVRSIGDELVIRPADVFECAANLARRVNVRSKREYGLTHQGCDRACISCRRRPDHDFVHARQHRTCAMMCELPI